MLTDSATFNIGNATKIDKKNLNVLHLQGVLGSIMARAKISKKRFSASYNM